MREEGGEILQDVGETEEIDRLMIDREDREADSRDR